MTKDVGLGAIAAGLLLGLGLTLVPARAYAQLDEDTGDEAPKPKKKAAPAVEPAEGDDAAATPKKVVAAPPPASTPPADADAQDATQPTISIAIERLAGVAYVNASQSDGDGSVGVTVANVGGIALNPYGATRVGVDFSLGTSGLWLGGALGFSTSSASLSGGGSSQSLGSLTIYSLTPRLGYRIPLSPRFDVTPRAGFSLAGGSVSEGDGNGSFGVFSFALSIEGLLAYRVTNQINVLGGLALDRTLAASVSQSDGNGGSSSSSDIKGALTNIQLWFGVGAYL